MHGEEIFRGVWDPMQWSEILPLIEKTLADPALRTTFTADQVSAFGSGNAGYTKGRFTIRYTDPKTKAPATYSGRYLTLFNKLPDGSWKIVEDMATPTS